jgi:dipeptidyl aminopeptidase/acylaminoacyl peptidase
MTIMRWGWLRGGLAAGGAAAVLLSCACQTTSAEAPRSMSLVDLAMIPRITDPQLSPDGRFVTYVLSKADWKADALVAHIFRQDVAGGPPIQLTNGDDERVERVSPDGRTIVFWAQKRAGTDLEKHGQLYLVPAAGGAAKVLTQHAPRVAPAATSATDIPIAWAPDGRSVYFLASNVPAPGRGRAGQLVTFEETDFEQQHLWKVDVATGAETQITRGDWSVISFRISRDGKHATLLRSPTPLTIDHYRSDIWVLDFETGALHEVTRNGVYETEADMSPDDTQVYFIADANNALDVYYGPSLFVVPVTGGAPRRVTPDATYTVEQAAWAPDGKSLLALANMGAHNEIIRVDVATGATRALTNGDHQIPGWSFVPAAGRMVFQIDEQTRLGDAWTLPVDGGTPTRVTGIYDSLARDFALPRQEKVSWKGADGVTIEGILYYPIGYQQGRRYPLVVQLHGGPVLSDKFGFGPGVILNYVPVLTGKGYAVLRPNFRGSAGYGPAFIRDIVNHYFNNMHLDVMAGIDALIQKGIADPDRLAVTGWSAGGTLVNKLITFTDRFKAASSGAGVANWVSLMAQTDALTRRTFWFGGTPWDKGANLDTFMDQSPIKYVANVKTPTLFFVGEKDTRVGEAQSQEMYRGLEHNGVPTKLYIAPDEGHDGAGWKLRKMLDKDNRELEWFEKYVMNRAYTFETGPDNQ